MHKCSWLHWGSNPCPLWTPSPDPVAGAALIRICNYKSTWRIDGAWLITLQRCLIFKFDRLSTKKSGQEWSCSSSPRNPNSGAVRIRIRNSKSIWRIDAAPFTTLEESLNVEFDRLPTKHGGQKWSFWSCPRNPNSGAVRSWIHNFISTLRIDAASFITSAQGPPFEFDQWPTKHAGQKWSFLHSLHNPNSGAVLSLICNSESTWRIDRAWLITLQWYLIFKFDRLPTEQSGQEWLFFFLQPQTPSSRPALPDVVQPRSLHCNPNPQPNNKNHKNHKRNCTKVVYIFQINK